MFSNKMVYRKRAFTLIELLIVIAIIGILASVVLIILTGAREKAHDAKEISHLKQAAEAVEAYYASGGSFLNAYEYNGTGCSLKAPLCGGSYCEDCSSSDAECFLKELQDNGYVTTESIKAMFGNDPSDNKLKACFYYAPADPSKWRFAAHIYNDDLMQNDGGTNDNCYEIGSDLTFNIFNHCSTTDN